jgi:cytoskeletal protein RodZ
MRLTLRTLLAYLDDLLEPTDSQQLEHKIEESDLASGIVDRIRDVMRRLRLGVPGITAKGMGGDANTVAEYLDNTMPAEMVPEFERVCLESDMHLAEVAACHQILALVLSGPAEVDPASRQRMYAVAREEGAATPAALLSPPTAPPKRRERSRPTVPDYLREPDRRGGWQRWAAAIAALLLLAIGMYVFLRPQEQVAQAPADAPAAKAPAAEQAAPVAPGEQADAAPPAEEAAPSEETSSKTAPSPTASSPTAPNESEAADMPAKTAAAPAPAKAEPAPDEVAPTPADGAAPATEPGMDKVADAPVAADTATKAATKADAPATAPAAPADQASQVGRFVSEGQQVLLRFEAPDEWLRLPQHEPLTAGERIICLPGFRGTISLNSSITAQVLGGTAITFEPVEADSGPVLQIEYGRLVLMNSGTPDAKIKLRMGDITGVLTLNDASSVAGIETRPELLDGTDPMQETPTRFALLYVGKGTVSWQTDGAAAAETIAAPARRSLASEEPAQSIADTDLPTWLLTDDTSEVDRRGADVLAANIAPDRSARLTLLELAQNRRNEVKALAVQGLGHLGYFEPMIEALGEALQRSSWDEHVGQLHQALARGPETAAKLRAAIVKRRPNQAAEIFRMLSGYTEAQLRGGEAATLVADLDSSDLDLRVLAIWNLERITGKDFSYRPQDSPNLRQGAVRRWRLWLRDYEPALAPAGGR